MIARGYSLYKRCACATPTRCACAWHLTIRRKGKPRFYVSLAVYLKSRGIVRPIASRGDAEELANQIFDAVIAGTYTLEPAAAAPVTSSAPTTTDSSKTFAAAIDADVAEHQYLASIDDERARSRVLKRCVLPGTPTPIGEWPIGAFTPAIVKQLFETVTIGQSNSSKEKYSRALWRTFEIAVREGWIDRSPLAGDSRRDPLLKFGKATMRWERIEPELWAKILGAARELKAEGWYPWFPAFLLAMYETGARPGELFVMHKSDVHFAENCLSVAAIEAGGKKTGRRGEPGRARLVPMLPGSPLREELRALFVGLDGCELPPTAYLFHNGIGEKLKGTWRSAWERTIARAHGIPIVYRPLTQGGNYTPKTRAAINALDLNIYDLRHEAALRWLAEGHHLNVIAKLLGHKDVAQLKTYLGIHDDSAIDTFMRTAGAEVPKGRRVVLVKGNKRPGATQRSGRA